MCASINRPLWNIPYRRNPFFTGRENVLRHLHHALHAENTVALSHPHGISGLGGIGKTQTALEYAYHYQAEYEAVFWVQADSAAGLTSGYLTLAQLLRLPERDEQDQRVIVEAVLRWLRVHTGWLLVFDSMDDPSAVEPFLPKTGRGHVLFTTRAHALGGIAQRLEIQRMEPETGALLLLRKASILPLRSALDEAVSDDRRVACEISQELDGLPLALDQAGAYVKETPCSLMDYLARYRTRHQDLLQARGSLHLDYSASVATTWSLSFEKVSQIHPVAVELLNFCAFLAPDAIPEETITGAASRLGPLLQPVAADPLLFDQAIAALLAYSLLRRNADDVTLSVHRLVQAVLRDALPARARKQWMQQVVSVVSFTFPDVEFAHWAACERCIPHALLCATWIEQEQMTFLEAARLLTLAGSYLGEHGRYAEAEPLFARALSICEQQLEPEHRDTASSVNNLAEVYVNQGKYELAEPLLMRALSICEQRLGPFHPSTGRILSNLATLYDKRGKYEQSEPLHLRVLAIDERALGPEHPDVVTALNNLALLYIDQGKYAQAEPLCQRALSICEQHLGPLHPDTARSLNSLALLYGTQGKYEQAESLLVRALSICEQQLGPLHPSTASSLNNLATLYDTQGKYAQAEPLYQRAVSICEQQLGADHPSTAQCLNNLARLSQNRGEYAQAEPLYRRALAIDEKVLGSDHPGVASALNNLATLYRDQGKYAQAEPLLVRALSIRERQLGPLHPVTAISLNDLALLYSRQGKYAQAEPLYQRALAIFEQQLGMQHPDIAGSLNNLAVLYKNQGKYEQAEPLYQRALAIDEKALGPEHPDVATDLNNLAELYRAQGKYVQAEPLLVRALSICEQQLGPLHPHTTSSLNNLAALYYKLGKYDSSTKE